MLFVIIFDNLIVTIDDIDIFIDIFFLYLKVGLTVTVEVYMPLRTIFQSW